MQSQKNLTDRVVYNGFEHKFASEWVTYHQCLGLFNTPFTCVHHKLCSAVGEIPLYYHQKAEGQSLYFFFLLF